MTCDCRFHGDLRLMTLCDQHWEVLEAELEHEPRIAPALAALARKVADEDRSTN